MVFGGYGWHGTHPNDQPPQESWLAAIAVLIIVYLMLRETGIRLRFMGAGAMWATTGTIVSCLGIYSISLASSR